MSAYMAASESTAGSLLAYWLAIDGLLSGLRVHALEPRTGLQGLAVRFHLLHTLTHALPHRHITIAVTRRLPISAGWDQTERVGMAGVM